ncbi:MAG: D-alanyl-D-alanine carboxypeptidase [Clostridiales bacterium]|jgi:D-alanyl-D-alanine carboxypeptidase (penicillin-binding protein 5/6)|nr:D-alanyl-D-alanine carboxypeptidase [Clostridiales bacterium]
MMIRKRILPLLLIIALLIPATASAQEFDSSAGVAALMEASTGQFLYLKNADEALPPASITKVMTLLLAFEALESGQVAWEDTVIVSEAAWRMGGSQMFLDVNQEVSYGDLVTGISVVSANDGSVALAEHLYGSEAAFVQRMNLRAAELGLTRTRFQNSTGIPAPGHEMSARDIAVLSRHLILTFPRILELETMREFTFNNIRQYNRNPLLGKFPGADGLKTGWTEEAGFCLAGTAEQDGVRMISVVLNTANETERLTASSELLTHGFRNFKLTTAVAEGMVVGEAEVKNGKQQSVFLSTTEEVNVVVPIGREEEIELVVTSPKDLEAPVDAGTEAATLEIRLGEETLATTQLVTTEDVARANIFVRLLRAVGQFFRGLIKRG